MEGVQESKPVPWFCFCSVASAIYGSGGCSTCYAFRHWARRLRSWRSSPSGRNTGTYLRGEAGSVASMGTLAAYQRSRGSRPVSVEGSPSLLQIFSNTAQAFLDAPSQRIRGPEDTTSLS